MQLTILNTTSPIGDNTNSQKHHHHINKLYHKKAVFHKQLDKQLVSVFKHCEKDFSSPICTILWNDVLETLADINDVNKETNLHQLYNDDILSLE